MHKVYMQWCDILLWCDTMDERRIIVINHNHHHHHHPHYYIHHDHNHLTIVVIMYPTYLIFHHTGKFFLQWVAAITLQLVAYDIRVEQIWWWWWWWYMIMFRDDDCDDDDDDVSIIINQHHYVCQVIIIIVITSSTNRSIYLDLQRVDRRYTWQSRQIGW